MRKLLFQQGARGYRVHYGLPGRPDIVFVKKRIVVFIDGCFWHKCPVCFVKPATRRGFWMKKIKGNVQRDKKTNKILGQKGWHILRFWEHEIKNYPEKIAAEILILLNQKR